MLDKIFGSPLHEHADPAQRVLGVVALPPDSKVLAQLLGSDPSPEVRSTAATQCGDPTVLAAALRAETEPSVRSAIAAALGKVLAATTDTGLVRTLLATQECPDAVRVQVALHTRDEQRRRDALNGMADENALVDVALGAEHASARIAAAERVHAPDPLRRLLAGARDKDRGVARLARERLDAIHRRIENAEAADAILLEAEALVAQPGPIVTAAVELDRRWKALVLGDDELRRARWDAVGRLMQQRFDRELDGQRAHARFEQRLREWLAALQPPPATSLPVLREELIALRTEAANDNDSRALAQLEQAERQLAQWELAAPALAAAEALVVEAEQLATGTPIDDAQLPARWQTVDLAARTPALTRRFEAALLVIEQRRLAIVRAVQQEQGASRQQLHTALHEAEQALAAGHLLEARAAADRARSLKVHAGLLPKPSVQRLSRVVQQLVELERWQQFGQQSARVQLCERAEALQQKTVDPVALAREVQQLRAEWKKLDEQHAGVPKPLWERFDAACERAYAPAARHFAEQSALHKQARRQREDFIAVSSAHAPTLLGEPQDWRAVEQWLRDTESTWRGPSLGSVEPGAWKKLDAHLKTALAPLREALTAARLQARQQREALITEAEALAVRAAERDTPARVKELQARWQAHAKSIVLAPRDERTLWERFRAACNAVFDARTGSRKEADERRNTQRQALEALCVQMEQLAVSSDADEAKIRVSMRDVQEQWRKAIAEGGPAAALEARFRKARTDVEDLLRGRTRASEAAVWQTLFAKERLCEELDALALAEADADPMVTESVQQRWSALPPLVTDWEQKLLKRRDTALKSLAPLADAYAREDHAADIKRLAAERRDALLELELMLGMESPGDLQKERLAVQVKHLRDRFKRTSSDSTGSAVEVLLHWCALPGIAEVRDRQRCERIVTTLQRRR